MSNKLKGVIIAPVPIIGKVTAAGKSAYEIWLDQGNEGNIQDFLSSLDKHKRYKQISPEKTWTITHNLNKYPSVTVVDSGFSVVYGDIEFISKNQLKITFTDAFSGEAYLN